MIINGKLQKKKGINKIVKFLAKAIAEKNKKIQIILNFYFNINM